MSVLLSGDFHTNADKEILSINKKTLKKKSYLNCLRRKMSLTAYFPIQGRKA